MNDFDRHDLTILVQAVEDAQAILAEVIVPGGITDRAAVLRIVAVLDHERVIRAARALRHRMSLQEPSEEAIRDPSSTAPDPP